MIYCYRATPAQGAQPAMGVQPNSTGQCPFPLSPLHVWLRYRLGRVGTPANATAFPHRSTPFVLNIHTRWHKSREDEKSIKWAKEFHAATKSFSQGVYVNFLSNEGSDRVKQAYTTHVWEKLVDCKRKWDPKNLFKMNQNISPY